MNQGRIWCVVSPNVGLPLLLGSVAATSLIVHACVLTHTTWMSNYWQGASKQKAAMGESPSKVAANAGTNGAFSVSITPVAPTDPKGDTAFVVTVTPNGAQHGVASTAPPDKLALAGPHK